MKSEFKEEEIQVTINIYKDVKSYSQRSANWKRLIRYDYSTMKKITQAMLKDRRQIKDKMLTQFITNQR